MLQKLRRKTILKPGVLSGSPQLSTAKTGREQRRRNHPLPQDVLVVVFEEACRQTSRAWTDRNDPWDCVHGEPPSRPEHDRCFVTLMRLTQVCSYWREAALGSALLWNRINLPCRDGRLLELHIQRAQDAGLDVSVHYLRDAALDAQFDAFLLQHMHRIRRLYVDIRPCGALRLPECNAPCLTGLFVKAQSGPIHTTPVQMRTHAPNLRQLSFFSVKPTIPSSNLALVTHLYLTNPYMASADVYVPYPELMDVLSHCQGLVEMDVDFKASESTAITSTAAHRIEFPNLRLLRVRNMTRHPSYYPLAHFKAPALRRLHVDNYVATLPPVPELLPTSLIDLALSGVRAAKIMHSGHGMPHQSLHFYSDADLRDEVFMCIHGMPPEMRRRFFLEVIRTHSLTAIETLHIHFFQAHAHVLDFQYLESLPSIRTIQIEGIRYTKANSLGSEFFKAITSSDMKNRNDSLILPKLEKVTIAHKIPNFIIGNEPAVKESVLAYDDLLAFLRYRAHHGKALKELYVHWKVVEGEWYSWQTKELASFVNSLRFFD